MRKADLYLILTSTLLILSFGISFFVLPKDTFSEAENRALTAWVSPTVHELLDGRAITRLSSYYSDHVPLRSNLTSLKAQTERLLGKRENNGVFFGRNGYLIPRDEYDDLSVGMENLAALSILSDAFSVPCTVLIAPRAMDVMNHCLPDFYSPDSQIFDFLNEGDLPLIFPLDTLREAAENGESVWYRTDHHWTTLGAYLAYAEIAPSLGITPYPLSYFRQETVSESFLGTSHAKIGGIDIKPDSVTLFRYEGDDAFTVRHGETGEITHGFYQWEALEKKDQYRVFLGGNTGRLSIFSSVGQDRPRLLLIKDSFANSLVPFLALHFDLELVDPRYDRTGFSYFPENKTFDKIFVIQGLDTLLTDRSLSRWTH